MYIYRTSAVSRYGDFVTRVISAACRLISDRVVIVSIVRFGSAGLMDDLGRTRNGGHRKSATQ